MAKINGIHHIAIKSNGLEEFEKLYGREYLDKTADNFLKMSGI